MNSDHGNEEISGHDKQLNEVVKQKRHRNRRKRTYIFLGSAAAVLLAGYLIMGYILPGPMEKLYSPKIQKYIKAVDYDRNFMLAAQNNLLQELHVSDTSGAYELAVGGVIADEEKAVILYSVSGPDLKEHQDSTDAIELIIEEDKPHSIGYGHNSPNKNETITYQSIQLNMEYGEELPKELKLAMNINEESLEVTFPIDHSRFAGMREYIDMNKSFVVDNQTVRIHDITLTPLQTMIRMETNTENTKNMNGFSGLRLADDQGNSWGEISNGTNGSGEISSGTYIAYMDSIYFNKPDSLSIIVDGAFISDKDQEFVINTATSEMVKAPDQRLDIVEIDQDQDQGYVYLQLEFTDSAESHNKPPSRVYRLINDHNQFADASGKKYKITGSPQSGFRIGDERTTLLYTVTIPNEDYKQPLTFEINEYPKKINQKIDIPVF
ncbi:DUF4179 domain-containing protein [Paenibacillus shunpengii]|uniref:DUF4179 domain-containing protein n=1 Tax=Paenibacillus shunpengii TaxID=2054424 RepID=A0ABW5SLX2_9BACL